jgi:hypothetical protein
MQMVLADPDYVRHNRGGHYPAERVAGGTLRHQPVVVAATTGFII